jgi:hypothetical protein
MLGGLSLSGSRFSHRRSAGLLTPSTATIQYVRVNHGCAYVAVTEEFLHGADVIAIFEQMRGERVGETRVSWPARRKCKKILGGRKVQEASMSFRYRRSHFGFARCETSAENSG